MLVLVAPGQGAQKPGFLIPWLDLPGVADRLRSWSDAIDLDLIYYGTEGTAEEILDTSVAQPLLVASALLSTTALFEGRDPTQAVGITAGHSVGEFPAAVAAGALSAEEAMTLVRTRGRAMAKAAAGGGTGMSAVLGGDPETVTDHLTSLGLTAANTNGAGQIVAAGTVEQLATLNENKPPEARVRPLKVAGAFHTDHMATAVTALETATKEITARDPLIPFVSNRDGAVITSGAEIMERMVGQVANPVRWNLCMETFQSHGASSVIEVCPGGTLTGLAKRAMPGVRTLALKSPADLDKARALVSEHADPADEESDRT